MKKRINTITYCTRSSIGSVLQSYALHKTLKDFGCENTLWIEEWDGIRKRGKKKNIKGIVKDVLKTFVNVKIKSAHRKRTDFIYDNIKTEYLCSYEDFEKRYSENPDDIYLAGSDQIWNPDRSNPIFFLDFVKNSKKISYAASMGNTDIKEEKLPLFKRTLGEFDYISVREQECKEVLREFTDKEISVNIDPTFLIEAEKWKKIEEEYDIKKPYILLYMLYWNDSLKEKIKNLKKRTGLPVYAVCSDISRVYADKCLFDVGIEEFLWLIDHAEYVVASSFHGVALSVIFNKKVAAVMNPSSPSRIENLLRTVSVPLVGVDELDTTDKFDYGITNALIAEERRKSLDYLKEAIG